MTYTANRASANVNVKDAKNFINKMANEDDD